MAKYSTLIKAQITVEVELDTDNLDNLFQPSGTADKDDERHDPKDEDAVHDALVDHFNDYDTLIEAIDENGLSIDRLSIELEPLKEQTK